MKKGLAASLIALLAVLNVSSLAAQVTDPDRDSTASQGDLAASVAAPQVRQTTLPEATPRLPIASPVTELANSAIKLEWLQSPVLFLPDRVENSESDVYEDDPIFETPLVWAFAGRLGETVTIDGAGKKLTLHKGDVLPQVALKSGTGVDERYMIFCTRNRTVQEEQNKSLFGRLTEGVVESLRDARSCLQDTDGDGQLDLAVVLSSGAPVTEAAPIAPIPYEMVRNEPIAGGEDLLSFSLYRVEKKRLILRMSITQMGKPMKFDTLTSGRHEANRFLILNYSKRVAASLGVQFEVLDTDKKAEKARLRWKSIAQHPNEFVVIPTKLYTTTTYGY